MSILDEAIAKRARSELPETWEKLAAAGSFGDDGLIEHANAVHKYLFGAILTDVEQDALDDLVIDYAGKCLALRLCRPGIDYWSKQTTQISATGKDELKTWQDRSEALKGLQKDLIAETRAMWIDVEPLLPNRRSKRRPSVPVVADIPDNLSVTPSPDDFEPAWGEPTVAPGTVRQG